MVRAPRSAAAPSPAPALYSDVLRAYRLLIGGLNSPSIARSRCAPKVIVGGQWRSTPTPSHPLPPVSQHAAALISSAADGAGSAGGAAGAGDAGATNERQRLVGVWREVARVRQDAATGFLLFPFPPVLPPPPPAGAVAPTLEPTLEPPLEPPLRPRGIPGSWDTAVVRWANRFDPDEGRRRPSASPESTRRPRVAMRCLVPPFPATLAHSLTRSLFLSLPLSSSLWPPSWPETETTPGFPMPLFATSSPFPSDKPRAFVPLVYRTAFVRG
jgi:hypothetical protein